jgi:hypothetical protein
VLVTGVDPGADSDNDGVSDVDAAVRGLSSGGQTNFDGALEAVNSVIAGIPAGEPILIVFLTDGVGNLTVGAGSDLEQTAASGAQIISVAVGEGADTCDPGTDLTELAAATGGACFEVDDPSQLPALVASLDPVGISGVTVSLNNGTPVPVDLDALGRFTVTLPGGNLTGPNTITATATADDGTVAIAELILGQPTGPNPDPDPDNDPRTRAARSGSGSASGSGGGGEALARTGSSALEPLALAGLLLIGFGGGTLFLRRSFPQGAPTRGRHFAR